jgi:UDP-N-acetyl-D-mannosaminuronic acid dehydrogenase
MMDVPDASVCIIGGAGRVGLPLGISFALVGVPTTLIDINEAAIAEIQGGRFPFKEAGGEQALPRALKSGNLRAVSGPASVIGESDIVVLVIGTPVDEYLNPRLADLFAVIDGYLPYFRDGQVLLLRSTVYPGTSERLQRYFNSKGCKVQVAFCPERIAEGEALLELVALPQIVSAFDENARATVCRLFAKVTKSDVIELAPFEAELSKLFSNAWRYIKFAVANQFYAMATQRGVDYARLYDAMVRGYERNRDLPSPGFAAGPCLFKDTMQLAAFTSDHFPLGQAAMQVNEGLPAYIVSALERRYGGLQGKTIGVLGMAFKAESDDARASLSYKLRKLLAWAGARVVCTDPYVRDDRLTTLECVLDESDILVLGVPHNAYKGLEVGGKDVVDVWGALGEGIKL